MCSKIDNGARYVSRFPFNLLQSLTNVPYEWVLSCIKESHPMCTTDVFIRRPKSGRTRRAACFTCCMLKRRKNSLLLQSIGIVVMSVVMSRTRGPHFCRPSGTRYVRAKRNSYKGLSIIIHTKTNTLSRGQFTFHVKCCKDIFSLCSIAKDPRSTLFGEDT